MKKFKVTLLIIMNTITCIIGLGLIFGDDQESNQKNK